MLGQRTSSSASQFRIKRGASLPATHSASKPLAYDYQTKAQVIPLLHIVCPSPRGWAMDDPRSTLQVVRRGP